MLYGNEKRAFHAFTRKRVLGREKEWKQCRRSDDNHLRWCLLKEREHNSFMKIKNYLSFFLSPCCFPLRRHIQIEHFAALSLLVVSCHFFHYHFSSTRSRCHFHLFLPQISIFSLLFSVLSLPRDRSFGVQRTSKEWMKKTQTRRKIMKIILWPWFLLSLCSNRLADEIEFREKEILREIMVIYNLDGVIQFYKINYFYDYYWWF